MSTIESNSYYPNYITKYPIKSLFDLNIFVVTPVQIHWTFVSFQGFIKQLLTRLTIAFECVPTK